MKNRGIYGILEHGGFKRRKGRGIYCILAVCILQLAFGISVTANTNARQANLKSEGNIDAVIDNKKIYISSADLRYLADEIDTLEDTYKTNTVDALNSIGSFFLADGSVVHDPGQNEVDTAEEKTALTFKILKDAISSSQSVASLSRIQATDKDGNLLYYADEKANNSRDLMNTTTANTGYPVYYRAITAENLTAGTAAWINGALIKGNGSDNKDAYDQGVDDEQENFEKNAEALGYSKVTYLGTGTTYNLVTFPGYKNFTTNNFIVELVSISESGQFYSWAGLSGGGSTDTRVGLSSATITKSYNKNTGILTISPSTLGIRVIENSDAVLQENSATQTLNYKVYLVQ